MPTCYYVNPVKNEEDPVTYFILHNRAVSGRAWGLLHEG